MRIRLSLLVALAAAPFQAQEGNPSMVVSTDWLAAHLREETLVILHVGSQKDYEAGHIPGARLVTLADVSITDASGLRLEMPPVKALEDALARFGVTDVGRVVVYAGTESVQSATRVWFTLDYLGLGDRASLLDGGLALWRAESRPLITEAPPLVERKFAAHPSAERMVNADWVRAHLDDPKVQLLDARTPEFYSGANAGGMPRAGHIPGARNVPFSSVFEANGKLKPVEALREIMNARGSQEPLAVSYCHIGQQATVLYFVARRLGLPARLYDGSFQDWSRRPELPLNAPPR
jgi:thiosulfate/3-mercaptopyruvate sulfurtransferase